MKLNHHNATRTLARPAAIAWLAAVACALVILAPGVSFSSPQKNIAHHLLPQSQTSRTRPPSTTPTGREVHTWAKETQEKLPDPETWNRAKPKTETDRSAVVLIKRGQAIVKRVIERGPGMSPKEAASYDAQMRIVVGQLDKLSAGPTTGQAAGGVSGCMKGCDGAYKGWGHGKGWKRFWCHVGCIKVRVGSGGVGVG